MKQISATILFLLITCGLFSQHTFKGKVISVCNGNIEEPLGFIKVHLNGETLVNTDAYGSFEVQDISGLHQISINTGSHAPFNSEINVTDNIENVLIILEYRIDCDFDNLLIQKKKPKFKDYLILENSYRGENDELNKPKTLTISQADTTRSIENKPSPKLQDKAVLRNQLNVFYSQNSEQKRIEQKETEKIKSISIKIKKNCNQMIFATINGECIQNLKEVYYDSDSNKYYVIEIAIPKDLKTDIPIKYISGWQKNENVFSPIFSEYYISPAMIQKNHNGVYIEIPYCSERPPSNRVMGYSPSWRPASSTWIPTESITEHSFFRFLSADDTLPVALKNQLLSEGISGRMILQAEIDKNGNASNISVKKSLHPFLDSLMSSHIQTRGIWIPASNYCVPESSTMSFPISFDINKSYGYLSGSFKNDVGSYEIHLLKNDILLRNTYSNSEGQFYFGQLLEGDYEISVPNYLDTISFKIKNDSCVWLSIDNKLKKVISNYHLCHCGSFEMENSIPNKFSLKVQFIDQNNKTPINSNTTFFSISENELNTDEQGKLNFDFKLASNNDRLTRGHRTSSMEAKPSEKILAYIKVKGYFPYWFYIVPSFKSDDTYIPEYFREFDLGVIDLKKNDKPTKNKQH
jgi:hypothetical protein